MNNEHEQVESLEQEASENDEPKGAVFANIGKKLHRRPIVQDLIEDNPNLYRKILMFIEQGSFDYIAAEAMGVTAVTWNRWLKQGRQEYEGDEPESIHARFYRDVVAAKGRGRLMAELEVRRDDAKFYLKYGPGKSKPGRPGWTETVAIAGDEDMPLREERDEPGIGDLAAVMALIEQLGFATPTEDHGKMLEYYSDTVEEASGPGSAASPPTHSPSPSPPENSGGSAPDLTNMVVKGEIEEIGELEEEMEEDKGHHPRKGEPWRSVEYDQLPDEYK